MLEDGTGFAEDSCGCAKILKAIVFSIWTFFTKSLVPVKSAESSLNEVAVAREYSCL